MLSFYGLRAMIVSMFHRAFTRSKKLLVTSITSSYSSIFLSGGAFFGLLPCDKNTKSL